MASIFYSKKLPDYGDLDNKTGNHPGFNVIIRENDGGVGLELIDPRVDQITNVGSSVFMNLDEAEELVLGITKAIERARPKGNPHKRRAEDC